MHVPESARSHLPNAEHIDTIFAHAYANPEKWEAVDGTMYTSAWYAAWYATVNAARKEMSATMWDAAWKEMSAAMWHAAWGASLALIAYPDCAYMLNMTPEQIKMYAHLDVKGAWLLYPAAIAMEKEYV